MSLFPSTSLRLFCHEQRLSQAWCTTSAKEQREVEDKGPGVAVSPPLLFFATLIVGLVLHFLYPLRYVSSLLVQLVIGLPVIIIGFGLIGWAARTLMKAGTDPRPHSPVKSIVVSGPFRFSRNPIYLSGGIILIGLAVAVDTLWLIILLPVGFALIFPQIRREEDYLEAKFGDEYRRYKRRVRRWL